MKFKRIEGREEVKRFFILSLILVVMVSQFSFFTHASAEEVEPTISVKLINYLGNKSEITIKPTDVYIVKDTAIKLAANVEYVVKTTSNGVALYQGSQCLGTFTSFEIIPSQYSAPLFINGREYLGKVSFTNEDGKYVRPINTLPLEDYVKGVVPNEMPVSWNTEALKVQAVAARTYARQYVNQVINDTISYQVYGGHTWYDRSTKAVDDTFGEVLTYKNSLISAVFSASNGGRTESNVNAWGSAALPYFTIKDDPYDIAKAWNFTVQKQQLDLSNRDLKNPSSWWNEVNEADTQVTANIKSWMLANGYEGKDIKIVNIPKLSLYAPSSGGRVTKGDIKVEYVVKNELDAAGSLSMQHLDFTGAAASKIRAMIGNRIILSYLVTNVNENETSITIQGKGDGHGVGMSQYGAKAMGEAGKSYKEILDFYYTGATLSSSYQTKAEKEEAPAELPPKGELDNPAADAALNGKQLIRGWFLDGSGVAKVEILVDGAVNGTAQYGFSRTDVKRVYPAYNNENAGYEYTLDTTKLSNGKHTITVRATGKNGKVTTLPGRAVTVSNATLAARGELDNPVADAALNGKQLIRGWFLDGSGVAKVEILVDGAVNGTAQYGFSRTDVKRVYPAYNNENAGYEYTLDTTKLSNGKHTITIRATGKNGKVTTLPGRTVTVSNVTLAARGELDNPAANATISGKQLVRGWFLDGSGIAKVEVLVDGVLNGAAQYGFLRSDVKRVYPAYNNGNAGYEYTLDTTKLSNGKHTITIRATGKNGKVTILLGRAVTVSNVTLPARGELDNPVANATLSGKQLVRGWFLDGSGVAKVEILVDGAVSGTAQYGLSRTDVKRVYPAYNNGNAGYEYMLDTAKLSNGTHTITIRATSKTGKVTTLPGRTVKVTH